MSLHGTSWRGTHGRSCRSARLAEQVLELGKKTAILAGMTPPRIPATPEVIDAILRAAPMQVAPHPKRSDRPSPRHS
jgi:hypothetical protein